MYVLHTKYVDLTLVYLVHIHFVLIVYIQLQNIERPAKPHILELNLNVKKCFDSISQFVVISNAYDHS